MTRNEAIAYISSSSNLFIRAGSDEDKINAAIRGVVSALKVLGYNPEAGQDQEDKTEKEVQIEVQRETTLWIIPLGGGFAAYDCEIKQIPGSFSNTQDGVKVFIQSQIGTRDAPGPLNHVGFIAHYEPPSDKPVIRVRSMRPRT